MSDAHTRDTHDPNTASAPLHTASATSSAPTSRPAGSLQDVIHVRSSEAAVFPAQVMRLPYELLCEIFGLLSLDDRAAVASVCSLWKDTSNTCLIVVKEHQKLGTLDDRLDRTGDAPLEFERVAYLDFERTAGILLKHMPRIRSLSIQPPKAELTPLLRTLLRAAAPQLRTFRLALDDDVPQQLNADGLFAQDGTPQLHTCVLKHLSNGLSLALSLSNLRFLAFAGPVSARELQRVLSTLVKLERMDLRVTTWKGRADDVRCKPCAPPPRLARLTLESTSHESPSRPLDFIVHSDVPNITISFNAPHERRQSLQSIIADINAATTYPDSRVESVDIRSESTAPTLSLERYYAIRTWDSRQRSRIFWHIPQEHTLDIMKQCPELNSTVSLAVNAPDVLFGAYFSNLRYLTLAKPHFDPDRARPNNTISCPALQYITLSVLHEFPAWFPRFCSSTLARGWGPRLRTIDVRGLRRDMLSDELPGLATIADSVTFGSPVREELTVKLIIITGASGP